MDNKIAIQAALTRQLFSTSNISQITSIILAAILAYLQYDVIDHAVVSIWFSLVVLLALTRTALVVFYQRSMASGNTASHSWLVRFRIGVLLSGITWGSASILLFPPNNPQHQIFLVFMLAGLTAGGLVSYSADLFSAIAFNVSVIVPLIVRMSVTGDSLSVAMSMALMLYLCFMIMSLRYINKNVSENIALHLESAEREETARISEQRYRLLLNHSPVGIFHYDTNLVITYCNDRFADILHNSAEHLIGLNLNTIKDQSILPALGKALKGELGYYEGYYMATLSDASGWVAMTCAPSLDSEGAVDGGVAIIQDITERKHAENKVIENEQRLLSILNVSPIAVRIAVGRGRKVVFYNPRYTALIKNTAATGDDPQNYYANPKDYEEILNEVERGNTIIDRQIKLLIPGGSTAWVLASYMPIQYQGEDAVLGWFYDITQSKQFENALGESEEKLRSLYELSPLGIALTDKEGRYIEFNESFRRICGYSEDELKTLDYWTLTPRIYEAEEAHQLELLDKTGHYGPFEKEYLRKDGTLVPLCLNGMLVTGRDDQKYIWSIVEDITERKLAEAHIHNLAFFDALTQLPNRRLLNDRLDHTIAISKRNGRYGALMFLDMDNFKPLNDKYGHGVGDLLLIEAARRIGSCIRETDTAARFGGDEFVVMLCDLNEDKAESTTQACLVAEKIRATLSEPYLLTIEKDRKAGETVEHHCTSSIGVAVFNSWVSREDILKSADMAMYQAKESGRNRVVVSLLSSGDASVVEKKPAILRLNWDESYDCGEPVIDQEHRKLFDLANALIEAAFERNENPQGFDAALERLLAHVVTHFADEEAILARYNYIDLDDHARAHKALVKHALQLCTETTEGGVTLGELVNFLADDVVTQHMLKMDRKFYPLFNKGSL